MFIVGIDIAKRSHMVRVIDSERQTVYKPFSIRNSCSGCNALLERLRKLTNHSLKTAVQSADWLPHFSPLLTTAHKASSR